MESDTWFLGWKLQRRCQERLVNRDQRWVTISKIAIPLKVCAAMAAEVIGACVLTSVLDLILCKSLSVQNTDHVFCLFSRLNHNVGAYLLAALRGSLMEDVFVAGSQEICAYFQVPFVAFSFGDVRVQKLRHVLGDGLGKGSRRSSQTTKLHNTGRVEKR